MKSIFYSALISLALFFFFIWDYNPVVNFQEGHHGWVSSHVLAIAKKTTAENGFLGFTCRFFDESRTDKERRHYYDRYPPLFAGIANFVLTILSDGFQSYIVNSRFFMIGIFVLTYFFLLVALNGFFSSFSAALIGTNIALGGTYFAYYKDMFHFDQPAILGISLFLFGLSRKNNWLLFALTLLAMFLGRSYSLNAFMLVWVFGKVLFDLLYEDKFNRFGRLFFPIGLFIFSVAISAFNIGINVLRESRVENVPLAETSIVVSAKARLGGHKTKAELPPAGQWKNFLPVFVKRTIKSAFGHQVARPVEPISSVMKKVFFYVYLLILAIGFILPFKSLPRREYLEPLVLIIFSGPVWMLGMKNLTAHHDYTFMYEFLLIAGVLSYGYTFIHEKLRMFVAILTSVLFIWSHQDAHNFHQLRDQEAKIKTSIVQNLVQSLDKDEKIRFPDGYRSFIKGAPYSSCFFFSDQLISGNNDETATMIQSPIN